MKVKIYGPITVEEWAGPWDDFYIKNSLRWSFPTPIILDGKKVGEFLRIYRDDTLDPEQWIIGEGEVEVDKLPDSHNWRLWVKNPLYVHGELTAGEIAEVEIGIPPLPEKYDQLKFYIV